MDEMSKRVGLLESGEAFRQIKEDGAVRDGQPGVFYQLQTGGGVGVCDTLLGIEKPDVLDTHRNEIAKTQADTADPVLRGEHLNGNERRSDANVFCKGRSLVDHGDIRAPDAMGADLGSQF